MKKFAWCILLLLVGACSEDEGVTDPASPVPGDGGADVVMAQDVPRVGPDIPDDTTPSVPCATDADCALALGALPACQATLCDTTAGVCVVGPNKDHTPCDDGNLCTLEDTCQAGVCAGGYDRPCEDHNGCTDNSCDLATGCVFTANTAPCDDGNACTEGDVCADGSCLGVGSETCACVADADCLPFDDDNLCNGAILCVGGTCAPDPTTVIQCDTGQDTACQRMTCNPATGACELLDLSDLPCSDGNPCTVDGTCIAGVCESTPASCPCETTGDCDAFDDADLCNGQMVCVDGACEVDPDTVVVCPAPGALCVTVVCLPELGLCEISGSADGVTCDDGDPCTVGDGCEAGECVSQPLDCDDGDPCTVGDGCEAGECVSQPLDCDDGDPCTDDSCDAATGCVHEAIADCGDPLLCDGYAAVFDGSGCIEIPDVLTTGMTAYTIEFWVRSDTEDQEGFVFDKIQDKDYQLPGLRIRYLTWAFAEPKPVLHYEEVKTTGNFHGMLTAEPIVAAQWRHYALVRRDNGIYQAFTDGVAQGLASMNAEKFLQDQSNDHPLYLGCQDGDGDFFHGRLDELRVSAGARYTDDFTPPVAAQVTDETTLLLFHFDEGEGTTVLDSSGGDHHGTWVGTAAWTHEDTPVAMPCP